VALTGYRSFVLSAGACSIPVTTHMVIEGTNTVEGTQTTNTVNATVTGTITDPTPANRNSGDESATVDPLTVSFND